MKRFRITVNGKEYEVGVEEIRDGQGTVSAVSAAAPAPAPQPVAKAPVTQAPAAAKPAAPAAAPKAAAKGGNGLVTAPMPGVISEILVKEGQSVKRGEVLLMLEAMKMQNEIMAPYDAEVAEIATAKGASVNTGDPLMVLKAK